MRAVSIIAALIFAAILFVVLRLLGLLIQFALVAALLGFFAGMALFYGFSSVFRQRSN